MVRFLFAAAFFGFVCSAAGAHADAPLRIITTLTAYADIAAQIGGERTAATPLAPPRFNPHFIEPRPSDVLRLKQADLFIHSGLDLEAWRPALVEAAGRSDFQPGGPREVNLGATVQLLEIPPSGATRADGDIHLYGNPHYWLSPENGRAIAVEIGRRLALIDPAGAPEYRQRTERYLAELDRAIDRWRTAAQPLRGMAVVAYHNEWIYLTSFLGLNVERFLEPKPGIPPSPRHLTELEQFMRQHHVRAILQATFNPSEAAAALAEKTGVPVAVLCQNVGELPDVRSYIDLIDYNIRTLAEALQR